MVLYREALVFHVEVLTASGWISTESRRNSGIGSAHGRVEGSHLQDSNTLQYWESFGVCIRLCRTQREEKETERQI